MKPTALNQTAARRYAKRAQVAFLITGAAALLIAFRGTRATSAPAVEPLDSFTDAPAGSEKSDDRKAPVVDAHAISARFKDIANAPSQDKQEYPETQIDDKIEDPGDQEIRFLGLVIEPRRRLALLKVGDRQRLVGAGESFLAGGEGAGIVRVVEVADDHVTVETASGEKKIEKSLSNGPAVTYLSGTAPSGRGVVSPFGTDPMARARAQGRLGQYESPIVPPPNARLMPADRKAQETSGDRQ